MWIYQGCERALLDRFMVKQIILVIECGMGYVKAVFLIGVPHGGTKSIKME